MGMHTRYECLCVSLSVAGGLGVCGNSKAGERFCRCHACMCGVFYFVNIGEIVNSIVVIMTQTVPLLPRLLLLLVRPVPLQQLLLQHIHR